MKISKDSIQILKNFASINSNVLIKKGNVLSTMNSAKNVFAEATLTESFPQDFGVYDTNEFLGILSLFADPELEFKDKYAIVQDGTSNVKFFAADPSVLTVPNKKVNFPATDVSFTLTATQLATIQKTASVLRAVDMSVVGNGTTLDIVVGDLKNATANAFNIGIGTTNKTFSANFKIENLRLMGGMDYEVSISSKKIARFVNTANTLTYYVALEATSTF